jgi:FkbH-like protein
VSNLSRLTQLLNKTNQMNLSTRRMTEQELQAWAGEQNRQVWGFHVSDKFGNSGLTGIVSIEADTTTVKVVDFILSCRVMGRKVEETMLSVIVDWARTLGMKEVLLKYSQTAKNKPCLDFLQKSGLHFQGENIFRWDSSQEYPLHPAVRLIQEAITA